MNLPESDEQQHYWESGWKGHEIDQLRRLARLPFSEKLAWLEEAHKLVQQIRPADSTIGDERKASGNSNDRIPFNSSENSVK